MIKWTNFEVAVLQAALQEMVSKGRRYDPVTMVEVAQIRCASLVRYRPVTEKSIPKALEAVLGMPDSQWTEDDKNKFVAKARELQREAETNKWSPKQFSERVIELIGINRRPCPFSYRLLRGLDSIPEHMLSGNLTMHKRQGKWVINLQLGDKRVQHIEVNGDLEPEQALELPTLHAAATRMPMQQPAHVEVETQTPRPASIFKQKVVVYGLLPEQAEALKAKCPDNIALNCVKSLKALSRKIDRSAICVQMIKFSAHLSPEIKDRFREYIPALGGVHSAEVILKNISEAV